MNAVALIDCNSFYVSCERLFQPHLNDKPVIVLSNNDGCIVSRSQEVKTLGIPVGIPLFQVRDRVIKHDVQVYSSNYTLYGDISSRVHEAIRHFSDRIENYSIDEAFVELEENRYLQSFFNAGVEIRTDINRWTGIPTSVGIGPTKTLAKIAGNVAKESPEGVFDIMCKDRQEEILAKTELLDIWGINTATAKKLKAIGISSAKELRDMDIRSGRKVLTVVGARMIQELRGKPNLSLELITTRRKSICCSRSFSAEVKSYSELAESVRNFVSTAAEKMRGQRLFANALNLFIETNRFKEKGLYTNSATIKIQPTDSTRELIGYALQVLKRIYRNGHGYRKSGVILLGLQPVEGETPRLFGEKQYQEDRTLMRTIDNVNAKYGRDAVRFGLAASNQTRWHMARNHLSKAYTTDPDQLLRVFV